MDNTYLKSLYEKKAKVYKDLNDLRTQAREAGKLTPEQKESFDKWNADFNEIEKMIEVEEKVGNFNDEKLELVETAEKVKPVDRAKAYSDAFEKYMRFGKEELTVEENKILRGGVLKLSEEEKARGIRAATASSTTTTTGGYTIPEGFSNELEQRMMWEGPFAKAGGPFREFNTPTGNDVPWPTIDDTANDGFLQSESEDAEDSSTGFTFGVETLKSYVYNAGLIPVTMQLLEDSYFPFANVVGGLLGERIGRTKNYYCTLGTGSSEPEGATVGARQGKYAASATAFTAAELIDLVASVDMKYQQGPKAGFMLHQLIEAEVRKLDTSTTAYTQPLWQPSFAAGMPSTILGFRYWINNDMASAMTTGQKVFLFGDFDKFVIRNVGGISVFRFNERYMNKLQVAFMSWIRFDSRVIQDHAIKYLDLT